jgi:predicted AlkP superfamily pyrophosphatase or phosphodiesterase
MLRRLGLATLLLLASRIAFAAPPTVILVSFDGTRPSDVTRLPTFARMAAQGARAERLVPAFPSNTFPNHVTFATGVSPDAHGIVNNSFVDPARGSYDYTADPTWLQVEPIWSLAARAGVVSASYHWVGSEGLWTSGLGPKHWKPFDTTVREGAKVEQILAWLDLPDPAERPRLVTAWFHGADGMGHRHGPDSPNAAQTLARQDGDLGALLDGLVARGLLESTTLLVVSDHGMTDTRRVVDFASVMASERIGARVIGGGGYAQVVLRGDAQRDARADRVVALARRHGLEAWKRGAAPPEYAVANPRFGDVVLVGPLGTAIAPQSTWAWLLSIVGQLQFSMRGVHGHRPELPEMAALFTAIGRGVAPGTNVGAVRAVDVAPTVLALLALPIPDWMEGQPIPLDAATHATGSAP